jgi:hypothetical protein
MLFICHFDAGIDNWGQLPIIQSEYGDTALLLWSLLA